MTDWNAEPEQRQSRALNFSDSQRNVNQILPRGFNAEPPERLCTVIDKVTAQRRDFFEVNKEQKHTGSVTDMPVDEGKEVKHYELLDEEKAAGLEARNQIVPRWDRSQFIYFTLLSPRQSRMKDGVSSKLLLWGFDQDAPIKI